MSLLAKIAEIENEVCTLQRLVCACLNLHVCSYTGAISSVYNNDYRS